MFRIISSLILAGISCAVAAYPQSVSSGENPETPVLPKYSPIATDGSPRPWDTSGNNVPQVHLSGPLCQTHPASLAIRDSLQNYISDKDARFGIAVIIEGNDTISVNGHNPFPMASVYKFPQALAMADYCKTNKISFADSIDIPASSLRPDTWSPMRDKYGIRDLRLPISEVLEYSLQQSDNNACDIIFTILGGPDKANQLMDKWGFEDIRIVNTEAEMMDHPSFGYSNTTTPIAMAELMDDFDTRHCLGSAEMAQIASMVENCQTGRERIVAALSKDAVCGHKTGTGPVLPNGRIMAINDCGYVRRIDGRRYTIAVFIAESGYDLETTEHMIRDISRIVKTELKRYNPD